MTEKTDIEKAIDWMENSTHANAYGDTRNAEKMVDYILSCLEKCKREEVDLEILNFIAYCASVEVKTGGSKVVDDAVCMDGVRKKAVKLYDKLKARNTRPKSDEEA